MKATGKGWAAGGPFSGQWGPVAGSGAHSIPHCQERLSRCSALLLVTYKGSCSPSRRTG